MTRSEHQHYLTRSEPYNWINKLSLPHGYIPAGLFIPNFGEDHARTHSASRVDRLIRRKHVPHIF